MTRPAAPLSGLTRTAPRQPDTKGAVRGRWIVGALALVVAVTVAACGSSSASGSGSGGSSGASGSAAGAPPTKAAGDHTVWLCFPGTARDPCAGDLSYTTVAPGGTRTVVHAAPAANPPVDCFYVYGTVSTQTTPNANFDIDPGEKNIALLQAAPFSRACRVYSPIYRQATVAGMENLYRGVDMNELYGDVLSAWTSYLTHYNDGRGVVLIGDSQGAYILESLLKQEIERHHTQLNRLVSTILTGGNVNVPSPGAVANASPALGDVVQAGTPISGTTLGVVRPCRSSSQTGCVIAYSSFNTTPPADTFFGRETTPNQKVLCTNPADLAAPLGKAAPLEPYYPLPDLVLLGGVTAKGFTTPWVHYPGRFTAACRYSDGASWLQIGGSTGPSTGVPYPEANLGPLWGLHDDDINIAMGNLLDIVHAEAAAWTSRHGQ